MVHRYVVVAVAAAALLGLRRWATQRKVESAMQSAREEIDVVSVNAMLPREKKGNAVKQREKRGSGREITPGFALGYGENGSGSESASGSGSGNGSEGENGAETANGNENGSENGKMSETHCEHENSASVLDAATHSEGAALDAESAQTKAAAGAGARESRGESESEGESASGSSGAQASEIHMHGLGSQQWAMRSTGNGGGCRASARAE